MPGCLKPAEEPEPAVGYQVADEEVQLTTRAPDDDLPEIYQEATFTTVAPAAVPPPPHYSTLPRSGHQPSHGELTRRLSVLSN